MNKITVYEGNSATIECAVYDPDGTDAVLTDFTATLTIKENKDDTTALITETGVIVDNDITFTISDTVNDLEKGTYYYEVTIESVDETLTIVQDRFIVNKVYIIF